MESYWLVITFIILTSFHVGCTLRCACNEDFRTCTSIYDMQVNFKTAQQICLEKGGKLLTLSNKTIDSLLFNKTGHFWIGAQGNCLSNSRNSQSDTLTLNREEEAEVCSSQCMSISENRTLTEHSCEEQTDGFFCDGIQWETCWDDRPSEVQVLNGKDCLMGPCEHSCEVIPGGHMCTCSEKYRPRSKYPEFCEYFCDSDTCPLLCDTCKCPEGFIKGETLECIDFDECISNHNCAQTCTNTVGSYNCFCHEGFMLVNKSECVPIINPTQLTDTLITASVNYTMSHAAFATSAERVGVTLFVILVISALIGFLYYLQKKKSDLLLKDSDVQDDITFQEA